MIVFLTSSPCIPGADRAILNPANGFVDRIRKALPSLPTCLFICSSPDTPERTSRFAQNMQEAFFSAGMPFSEMRILDNRSISMAKEWVQNSQLMILSGGHVPTQNAFFHKIGLAELLRDYQGVILGISAGTMNAASTVYAQPEMEGEAVDPAYRRFLTGLSLTDVQILPHYQMVKDDYLDGKRLFEDITFADSAGRVFYAMPDGSYLLKWNGRETVFGECYVIHNGCMEKLSSEGEKIELREVLR